MYTCLYFVRDATCSREFDASAKNKPIIFLSDAAISRSQAHIRHIHPVLGSLPRTPEYLYVLLEVIC